MSAGIIPSERVHLLVYGPSKPHIEKAFSDQFVLHVAENVSDLERLSPELSADIRGMAVTFMVPASAPVLARFPKLEIISSFGVGYDHVDSVYAREHGIVVTHTPDVLTEEVADFTLGLLTATLREFIKADRYLRSGLWRTQAYPLSVGSLRDRKVGIVGMGRIGKTIAKRLEGFDRPIVYHSRKPAADVPYKHYPDLVTMAKDVDVLIAIVPGGPATKNMISAEVLKALGSNGVLINVARGSVVDEPALIEALQNKTILAAGLDVFAQEPKVPQALIDMKNVVLLPHVASATDWTRNAMGQLVVDNLAAWAAGKDPITPVVETPWPPKKK